MRGWPWVWFGLGVELRGEGDVHLQVVGDTLGRKVGIGTGRTAGVEVGTRVWRWAPGRFKK